PAAARVLITAGADVNATNDKGETAAQLALRYGRSDALILLVQQGAKVSARVAQDTALLAAVTAEDPAALRRALADGADPNVGALRARDWATPDIPMTLACAHGDMKALRLLLDAGGTPDVVDRTSRTPLLWATARGDSHMVQLLLAHGADPS